MPEISKVTIPLILFHMYIMPPPTHTHTNSAGQACKFNLINNSLWGVK